MAYAVAGLATASGGAISAEAEIHYSGLVNYKFNKESRGYEAHTFPLSHGAFLLGFRYVRGASDNSATFVMEGGAVSNAFRIYSFSFARSVAAALPRGLPAFASIAVLGCNMAGCGSSGAVAPRTNI